MEENKVEWGAESFLEAAANYHKMVHVCSEKLEYFMKVSGLISPSEGSAFAKSVVYLLSHTGNLVQFIRLLIEEEAQRRRNSTCMRGTVLSNKVESFFLYQHGKKFLHEALEPLVTQVIQDEELNLEIDPRCLEEMSGVYTRTLLEDDGLIDLDDILRSNREHLHDTAQVFLDRMFSCVHSLPREIAAVAHFIHESAKDHAMGLNLVANFLVLRFFAAAIVSPECYGIISPELHPSKRARRNLILIGKLLQALMMEDVTRGNEDFMACMQGFHDHNKPAFVQFLVHATQDRQCEGGAPPFQDFRAAQPLNPLVITDLNRHDLFVLHHCLFKYRAQLKEALHFTDSSDISSEHFTFFQMLHELGPAPWITSEGTTVVGKEATKRPSSHELVSSGEGTLFGAYEKANFFFEGLPAKDKSAVLYIIVSRVTEDLLANVDGLIGYVYRVLQPLGDKRYSLVVDMSWTPKMTPTFRGLLSGTVTRLYNLFEYKYRKNLQAVFMVHPSTVVMALFTFLKTLTSRKLRHKLHEMYDWKDLTRYIATENIALPATSKDFITKTFLVTKVNAKGKAQKRLIKFTPVSFLNIDPKTRRIQNEKRLEDVERVVTWRNNLELHFTFLDTARRRSSEEGAVKRAGFLARADPKDSIYRRYICRTEQERNDVLEELFEAGFRSNSVTDLPFDFPVIKVNSSGTESECLFKITCDSLLQMDGNLIKKEISFAGIEGIDKSTDDDSSLWIRFKGKNYKSQVRCKEGREAANRLLQCIQGGIARYETSRDEIVTDIRHNEPERLLAT